MTSISSTSMFQFLRLQEAKIWEGDTVRWEEWFDSEKGGVTLLLGIMIAEGKLIRRWSDEWKQFAQSEVDIKPATHLAV